MIDLSTVIRVEKNSFMGLYLTQTASDLVDNTVRGYYYIYVKYPNFGN